VIAGIADKLLKALVLVPTNYIISTSGKTSASGVGGIELKFQTNHISHKLPAAASLKYGPLAQCFEDAHCSFVICKKGIK